MAKKKAEIALQDEVNTQEEWETMLQREGLIVVDIYQDWCGPCKAVSGLFRRLKNELNDDLLHFVIAKADTIESLEKHRGRSQPCFHFYGGGYLVAAVEGVNPPELEKCIIDKLKQEHEVMKGEIERIEIRDPLVVALELEEAEMLRRLEEEEEVIQEVSVLVIKPDIHSAGKGDEIIEKLSEYEIEVLERKDYTLTEDDVDALYQEQKSQVFYRDMLHFLTSGVCEILLCTKVDQNIIEDLRKLVGPALSVPSEEEIDQLRPKYATDLVHSAFHVPETKEEVERALNIFFPDYEPAIVRVKRTTPLVRASEEPTIEEAVGEVSPFQVLSANLPDTQRTVAIIRPEAYEKYKNEILEKIRESGFQIAIQKEIEMSIEQAQEYYSEQVNQPYYNKIVQAMTSGPCLVLLLSKPDAINSWREIIGPSDPEEAISLAPESLRARFMATTSESEEDRSKKSDEDRDNLDDEKSKRISEELSSKHSQKSDKEKSQEEEKKDNSSKDEAKVSQEEKNTTEGEKETGLENIAKEGESNTNADTDVVQEEPKEKIGDTDLGDEVPAKDNETKVEKEVESPNVEEQEGEGQNLDEKTSERSGEPESVDKKSSEKQSVEKESAEDESLKDKEGEEEEVVVRKVRINLIHGSMDETEAERDIAFFFPIERTVAAIKPDAYANRDEIIERIKENGFFIESRKDLIVSTEIAQEMYRHVSTKGFFDDLVNHITSGRSLFLVLSRQDAVACWRQLIGHTDPDKAADEAPDSIRATYGRNVVANAVYGAASSEEAEHMIELIFTEPTESVHETVEEEGEDEEQRAESAIPTDEINKDEPNADAEDESAVIAEGGPTKAEEGESEVKPDEGSEVPVGDESEVKPASNNEEEKGEGNTDQPPAPTEDNVETPSTEQETKVVLNGQSEQPESNINPEESQPEAIAENQNASIIGSRKSSTATLSSHAESRNGEDQIRSDVSSQVEELLERQKQLWSNISRRNCMKYLVKKNRISAH